MIAAGVGQRAIVAALTAPLARRGIKLAYQTVRNYRCQTSRLLGAGARERVALVDGVDHGHLRAAPGAVGRDGRRPVAAAALERALARSGVCGEAPVPGMLGRVLDRLKPIRALARSRLSVLARVARQSVSAPVRKSAAAATPLRVTSAREIAPAISDVPAVPGTVPAYMEGWRPPPPLRPVQVRTLSSADEIRQRADQEDAERRARERRILQRDMSALPPGGAALGTNGEAR